MGLWVDQPRLARLCGDLAALSGVRVCVLGHGGETIYESSGMPAFCEDMAASGQCHGCDLHESGADNENVIAPCRCHEGLCAMNTPLSEGDRSEALAWLSAGPFREDADGDAQQTHELRPEYMQLTELSSTEIDAISGMMQAVSDSIRLRELIRPAAQSDLMRLQCYIDEHYMEKLSLTAISAQLHIGRTRLCALAKLLSGGDTLSSIIANKRIGAAKALLIGTNNPVWAVAEAVGISDYNYFSKIFRAAVGISPSQYRKRFREAPGDMQE